jgi:hypothetical protein
MKFIEEVKRIGCNLGRARTPLPPFIDDNFINIIYDDND